MGKLNFLYQFIINSKTVGAVIPSSRFLGDQMIERIDFNKAKYIVEYGPGTGVFTEKLIEKRNPKTVLLLVENNIYFYSLLIEKYEDKRNIFIVYGSAEHIEQYLMECDIPSVDYVISGLPFTTLPKKVSFNILSSTSNILKEDGEFITFQYTTCKKEFINQILPIINIKREYRNFPPAYIFSCTKHKIYMEEERYGLKNTDCG